MTNAEYLEFFASRVRIFFVLSISLFLVAFGLWTFYAYMPLFVGLGFWVLLAAVPVSIKFIREIADNSPRLILTKKHIEYKQWPFKIIEWRNIKDVNLRKINSKYGEISFFDFEIADKVLPLREMSRSSGLPLKFYGSTISINLTLLKLVPEELETIIISYIENSRNNIMYK